MPKFYVELMGQLQVRWGIEIDAANRDIAEAEALRSAPEDSNHWALGTNPVTNIEVDEVEVVPQETPDHVLGRLELERKYTEDNEYGQHKEHDKQCWIERVNDGYTLRGYWDWVYQMVQEGQQDATQTSSPEE